MRGRGKQHHLKRTKKKHIKRVQIDKINEFFYKKKMQLFLTWQCFWLYRNPNEHHRQDPVLLASKERNRFRSVSWDEYDSVHQKYLEIGMQREKIDFMLIPC